MKRIVLKIVAFLFLGATVFCQPYLAFAQHAGGGMLPDASNAKLPEARVNLGVGLGTGINITGPEYGGVGDGLGAVDGTVGAGSTAFSSASMTFTAADVGKTIILDGAGAAGAPLVTTIAAVTGANSVTLAAPAVTALPYRFATGCAPSVAQSGAGSYAPGDTVTISGGTGTAAVCTIRTTKIVTAAINAAGAGGTNSAACVVRGSSGTAQGKDGTDAGRFQLTVVVSGGAITSITEIVSNGFYTTNPASLVSAPVVGCGVTGATMTITMGPGPMTVSTPGAYTVAPTSPAASTTSGSGTGLTVTLATVPTRFKYGTNNRDAFASAITALNAAPSSGALIIPAGVYLIDGVALPVSTRGIRIAGAGSFNSWIEVSPTYAGEHVFASTNTWGGNPPSPNTAWPFAAHTGLANVQTTGYSVTGLAIVGFRNSAAPQSAITFYDHADTALIEDVFCWFMSGSCFRSGVLLNDTQSYIRESHFRNIRSYNSGGPAHPSIDINSADSPDGATSNELDFSDIDVYAPYGCGFALRNANATRVSPTFRIVNLRIEGLENNPGNVQTDLLCIGDPSLGGGVANAYMINTKLISPYEGTCALRAAGVTLSKRPFNISFDGYVAGGDPRGRGFCLDGIRDSNFTIHQNNSLDTNLTASADTAEIWLNEFGKEGSYTYDIDPLALPKFYTPNPATSSLDNRILNGDYLVDQFHAGVASTPAAPVTNQIDGWTFNTTVAGQFTYQRIVTSLPAGFQSTMLITTGAGSAVAAGDKFIWRGLIEQIRVDDLGFGAPNAVPLIFSKWLKSSVSGSLAISVNNNFGGTPSRSYVNRCVLVAAVWTECAFQVPPDVSGSWGTSGITALGMQVIIDLGSGANFETATIGYWQNGEFYRSAGDLQLVTVAGATLQMTNARLYPAPLPVQYAAKSIQQTILEAQRYRRTSFPASVEPGQNKGLAGARCVTNQVAAGKPGIYVPFDPPMRSTPNIITYNPAAAAAGWRNVTAGTDINVTVDPATAIGSTGIEFVTTPTVAAQGDTLCIHYSADAP
jgi:hypothetical protein